MKKRKKIVDDKINVSLGISKDKLAKKISPLVGRKGLGNKTCEKVALTIRLRGAVASSPPHLGSCRSVCIVCPLSGPARQLARVYLRRASVPARLL